MGQKFARELKLWSTPAFLERQVIGRGLKTIYKVGRAAFRRPLLTAGLYYALGKGFRGHKKYLKRKKAGEGYAGRMIMKEGKYLF